MSWENLVFMAEEIKNVPYPFNFRSAGLTTADKSVLRICIVFVAVHLFVIAGLVVFQAYEQYPVEATAFYVRYDNLEKIADAVEEYRDETGNLPESIDSLLYYNEELKSWYFGPKPIKDLYWGNINQIDYRIVDNEPVITDLGPDEKIGGMGWDMDIVYPEEYQPPFSFRDFVKTEQFLRSVIFGFILALVMSICLYGMWRKYLISGGSIVLKVFQSILFVLFEIFLATLILGAHVYPHH